jgi:CubicO group peptidase (beta-lactamase class C family)
MNLIRSIFPCLLAASLAAVAEPTEPAPAPSANGPANAAAPEKIEKQIDHIFKEWDTTTTPGAAVAVIKEGKVLLDKGYGIANLEYGVPIKPETIFHVASVSKQFTAMAIVLLELDGKLSLEDDVHKYLPELPDYGYKITIRNLLQHTSGIRDQWQTLGLAGWDLEDVITQDQILRMLFRQKELNFPPGTEHLYSNGGFTLLAEIVTRVSGTPFPEFCSGRIFKPLGMAHTHFHQDLTQLVPGRAYSYHDEGGGYAASPLNYANVGATSLFTTAGDLVTWLDNFRVPKVGGAAAIARLQEQCVLSDGTKIDYGLGVALGTYRGLRTVSHGGGDAGYRSFVLWFPEEQLGVAVVSNLASFNAEKEAKAVAVAYIGDKMAPKEAKSEAVDRKFIAVEPKELEKYVGIYPIPKIGQVFTLEVKDGKLLAVSDRHPPLELRPVGPAQFYVGEIQADVEFTPNAEGGMAAKITQPGGVNKSERISADQAKIEADLRPYTGVYWSEELETQYAIYIRDGVLVGMHAHHGEFDLKPILKDQFSTSLWFGPNFSFVRDAAGQVAGVNIGGGRVSGIHFDRKAGGVLELRPLAVVAVSGDALAAIVGRYDYKGPILTVTQDGNRVFAQLGVQPKFEIFPRSDTEYFWKAVDAKVTFVRDANGRVVSATHSQNGHVFSASRIPDVVEVNLDEAQISELLGDYDVGSSVKMTISRDSGHLYTRITGQPKLELGATSGTGLYLKQWDAQLTFVKDPQWKGDECHFTPEWERPRVAKNRKAIGLKQFGPGKGYRRKHFQNGGSDSARSSHVRGAGPRL